jgi:transposase-like protein
MVKAGYYGRNNVQRFKCQQCGKRFAEPQEKPLDSRLPKEKVLLILHCLVEGNSIRTTARMADVEKRTVMKWLEVAPRMSNGKTDRFAIAASGSPA